MKLILLLLCVTASELLATNISGVVFVDANSNGVRDPNEAGLKGVAVSDQVTVVQTDVNGFYHINNTQGFGYVSISTPQGYKPVRGYYHKLNSAAGNTQADFPLSKVINPTQFRFIHASDTHISDKSVDRVQKFRAVTDSLKPDFVIVTGDLVKDALRVGEKEATGLYELYKSEIQKFQMTVWNAPGNHEIFGIERELSKVSKEHPLYGRKMFRSYLGPDYYSFNFGGLHWVALNSLDFEDMWYYGAIDSVQREWLKKDLAVLDPATPVVTFQHVPFFSGELSVTGYTESGLGRTMEREKGVMKFRHVVSNAHEIIGILRTHPFPLALGGHHHSRQRYFLQSEGQQTRFEQAAAVVGPVEVGTLKMPSGVTLYHVKDGVIDEGTFIILK